MLSIECYEGYESGATYCFTYRADKIPVWQRHGNQTYLRLPLLAAEASCPVTEAPHAVFDGVFFMEAVTGVSQLLVRILVQILAHGVGFGPATGQCVR